MFTGIVENTGTILSTRPVPGGRRLTVEVGPMATECQSGASLCVSGVCLTVAGQTTNTLDFDVITETLDASTLGSKRVGDRVNLERSLKVGDRLDGHFVQGHVDGRATVIRVSASSREWVVWLAPDPQIAPYIIPKGSVAIDGVSLTIAAVEGGEFSVAFIPTTLERTTLSNLRARDVVNIETDIIARTIIHHLSGVSSSTGVTMDALREAGLA
ncbi:MAG: riboflavin synthase [Phycisphaerae bacterium]|jgi:riboflavin synthase